MVDLRLSRTETRLLRLFPRDDCTVSDLADELKVDLSWASRCISHLKELGMLETIRKGQSVHVQIPPTPFGNSLSTLLQENPSLNLDAALGGSSLTILPLLLPPGHTTKDIVSRTDISIRNAQTQIRKWREMGMVQKVSTRYHINPRHELLLRFVGEFTHHLNLKRVKTRYPTASIVWESQDQYMISIDCPIKNAEMLAAGSTAISHMGYDIISRNEYYLYNPGWEKVSEAEALIQTMLTNPNNPRPRRYIQDALKSGRVTLYELRYHAKKYGIEEALEEAI